MPAKLTWGKDHYIIVYSGVVVADESIRVYGELVGTPRFDVCKYAILDCSAIERVDYSEIRPFLECVSKEFPHNWERRIFRHYDEAQQWAASLKVAEL